jgi:hypothetical protein
MMRRDKKPERGFASALWCRPYRASALLVQRARSEDKKRRECNEQEWNQKGDQNHGRSELRSTCACLALNWTEVNGKPINW